MLTVTAHFISGYRFYIYIYREYIYIYREYEAKTALSLITFSEWKKKDFMLINRMNFLRALGSKGMKWPKEEYKLYFDY